MNKDDKPVEGFFYQANTIRWILRIFYSICVLLVLADFVVHRHIVTAAEKIPAFYAFYGFVACVVLVLISTQIRKVLIREENYYDDGGSDKGSDNSHDKEQKNINSDQGEAK
jgi:hypothetical protein